MSKPNVLITSYLEPEFVERIRREFPEVEVVNRPDLLGVPTYGADHHALPTRTPEQEAEWLSLLGQAEILFDFDVTHRADLPEVAPNVKWIQSSSSGIGQFVKNSGYATRTRWIFTTASGIHARPLAEFVLMSMLMYAKDAFYLNREQTAQHWQRYCGFELTDKTVAIIGLGNVGRECAKLAKAIGMRVIGSRNYPSSAPIANVDEVFGPKDLEPMLKQADFLVLIVPHTPDTEKMLNAKELAMLPRGAFLINIARGIVVDKAALVDALKSGQLGGAALDVTDPEPLPAGDPLWTMPNVLISPHSASTADSENRKLVELFCTNLKHYLAKEPLINELDTVRLY